jgi:hypothetical protein
LLATWGSLDQPTFSPSHLDESPNLRIWCGDDAEPATALAAKAALQTIVAWEPTPLYVALTRKALPAAVRQLSQDAQRCCFATPLSLALPPIARVLHAGFVMQIGQPPVWSTSLRLMPSEGVRYDQRDGKAEPDEKGATARIAKPEIAVEMAAPESKYSAGMAPTTVVIATAVRPVEIAVEVAAPEP